MKGPHYNDGRGVPLCCADRLGERLERAELAAAELEPTDHDDAALRVRAELGRAERSMRDARRAWMVPLGTVEDTRGACPRCVAIVQRDPQRWSRARTAYLAMIAGRVAS